MKKRVERMQETLIHGIGGSQLDCLDRAKKREWTEARRIANNGGETGNGKTQKKKEKDNGNGMEWKNKNPVVEAGAHSARTGRRRTVERESLGNSRPSSRTIDLY